MKSVLGGLLLSTLLLVAAPCSSYAVTGGCAEPGMHEEGMSMPDGMGHHDRGMRRQAHRLWMQLMRLGLNENQKEAIRDIRSKAMKDAISKRAEVRIARLELRELLAKDPVDMQVVSGKLKEIASLEMELRLSRIKAMEDIRAQLTPEQKKKFRENLWENRGGEVRKMGTPRQGNGIARRPARADAR
jgi:Spy/CpxP family protein refolding chaperone